jgi:GTP cyclohydrolase I
MTPEEHVRAALSALGFDDDAETAGTPERFVGLLRELRPRPTPPLSTFPLERSGPVVLRQLPFYSMCAHHLLPFFGHADVAYWPSDRVAGFSGVAARLRHHARRPQLEERLARDLADDLTSALQPRGLVVRLTARQLCMEMRGAESTGTIEVVASSGHVEPLLPLL